MLSTVDSLSRGLLAKGIGKGDKIALMSHNRPEWNFCDFAINQLGAAVVPLYPTLSHQDLSFIMKFIYPEDSSVVREVSADIGPDLKHPELYNFKYKVSGNAKNIEPVQIFDDGEFTYMKFRDINAELPAIFRVESDNTESLVNYRLANGYIVVERVAGRFTLRHGNDIICVFNEAWGED